MGLLKTEWILFQLIFMMCTRSTQTFEFQRINPFCYDLWICVVLQLVDDYYYFEWNFILYFSPNLFTSQSSVQMTTFVAHLSLRVRINFCIWFRLEKHFAPFFSEKPELTNVKFGRITQDSWKNAKQSPGGNISFSNNIGSRLKCPAYPYIVNKQIFFVGFLTVFLLGTE